MLRTPQNHSSEDRTRNDDWMHRLQSRFPHPSWAPSPSRLPAPLLSPPLQHRQPTLALSSSNSKLFISNCSLRIYCNNNKNRNRSTTNLSLQTLSVPVSPPPLSRRPSRPLRAVKVIYRPGWVSPRCQEQPRTNPPPPPPPPRRPPSLGNQIRPPVENRKIDEMRWLINYRSRRAGPSRSASRKRETKVVVGSL